ncbi:MAG: tetratricopeptide repeat protein [Planctomycetaceae bacterium]
MVIFSVMLIGGCSRPSGDLVFAQGLQAVDTGQWDEVQNCVQTLQSDDEFRPHAELLKGFLLKHSGNSAAAFVIFSRANSHPETREEAYHQAGEIRYQEGQFSEAILLFRQVLDWNPDRLETCRMLAAAYYDIGAVERAMSSLDRVNQLAPGDFRPLHLQATILKESDRMEDAADVFEKAAALVAAQSPAFDEIRLGWAEVLIRLRHFEKALDVLEPAGPCPDVQAARAQALLALRRFGEAESSAEVALNEEPDHVEAGLVAAQLDERHGNTDKGIERLRTLHRRSPHDLRIYHRLADLLASAGQADEALTLRREAGRIAELRSEFSAAHQAIIHDAETADLRLRLAELAVQLGEVSLADGWYRAATGLAPDDLRIRQAWMLFRSTHASELQLAPKSARPSAAREREGVRQRDLF